MYKKIMSAVLCMVLLTMLSACANEKEVPTGTPSTSGEAYETVSGTEGATGDTTTSPDETTPSTQPDGTKPEETFASSPDLTTEEIATAPSEPEDTSHKHNYKKTVVKPSCTKEGATVYTCGCGYEYKDDVKPATGHKWSSWKVTKKATENEVGKEQKTCSVCDEKEYRDIPKIVKGHTHSYSSSVTKAATCTAEGIKTFTCSCGAKYEEVIGKTAHNYSAQTVKATCAADGYTKHTCSGCGNSYKDNTVKALGHDYKNTVVKATCTAQGYTTHICSRCDSYYVDGKTNALGHNYQNKVVNPTCSAEGYTTHTCSRCQHYYVDAKISATGHKNTKSEKVDATCSRDGREYVVCRDCGATVSSKTIPATGKHNFRAISCADAYKEVKTNCGSVDNFLAVAKDASDWLIDVCSGCHAYDKSTRRSKYSAEEASKLMLGYVNGLRNSVELEWYAQKNLTYDAKLTELANIRAKELYTIGYMHGGPGSTKTNASENISMGRNRETLIGAYDCWKASSGHYKNMINDAFVRFGYGRYMDDNGTVYNVQLFWDKFHGADNYQ